MSAIRPARLYIECGTLYVLSLVATFFNQHAASPQMEEVTFVAVIVILMFGPWVCGRFVNRRSSEASGAEVVLSLKDACLGLGVALGILLPVCGGAWAWYTRVAGMTFGFDVAAYASAQPGWLERIVTQLLIVALPEEFFYRGYLMTTLRDGLQQRGNWTPRRLNVTLILLTSVMFAVAHTMGGDVVRLNTFFPALLFGFVRTRCDGILGSILLHACCNLMMQGILVHFSY